MDLLDKLEQGITDGADLPPVNVGSAIEAAQPAQVVEAPYGYTKTGRIRKRPVAAAEKSSEPKKRGRKPKQKVEEEATPAQEVVAATPKKRGRKPKQKVEEAATPKHEDREHYLNGGSQIDRRLQCRASMQAEKFIEDSGLIPAESPEATVGTKVHECIEVLAPFFLEQLETTTNDRAVGEDRVIKRVVTEGSSGSTEVVSYQYMSKKVEGLLLNGYTKEHITAAIKALNNIVDIVTPARIGHIAYKVEKKYILDEARQLGGTSDVIFAYSENGQNILHVWDYKNGVVPKNARKTKQVLLYACAIQSTHKKEGKPIFDIIHTHIFQPNTLDPLSGEEDFDRSVLPPILRDTKGYSTKTYTAEEIDAATEMFLKVGQECFREPVTEDMFATGEECNYCKYVLHCPEHKKQRNEVPAIQAIETATEILPAVRSGTDVTEVTPLPNPVDLVLQLTDEQIVQQFALLDYIDGYKKALIKHIYQRDSSGSPIEGLSFVAGRSQRKYNPNIDPTIAGQKLKEAGIADPYKVGLKGITELTEELKKLNYEKDDIDKFFANFTIKTEAAKKIVLTKNLSHYQTRLLENVPKQESSSRSVDATSVFGSWEGP